MNQNTIVINQRDENMIVLIDNINYSLDVNSLTAAVSDNRKNENLPENLNIPSTVSYEQKTFKVTSISNQAFYGSSRIKNLTLNENLIKIGDNGFDQCNMNIETLEFPSSLRELGHHCFAVNDIKRVKISSFINQISNCPFGYNNNLVSIEVDQMNPYFCNDYQFALYNKKQTRLIQVPCTLVTMIIPSSVNFIDNQALDKVKSLETLYINGNIKKYFTTSINACTSLKTIYYLGRTTVGSILTKSTTPKVITCYSYNGNFSDIEVEKRACTYYLKTCNCKYHHYNDVCPSVFVFIVYC